MGVAATLAAARQAWLKVAPTSANRAERERSTFMTDVDEAGRVVDFHALRHSFITALARSGVHPKVAQQLARHSTITLTMDRYSHVEANELSVAVANLPDLSAASRESQQATGTDGRQVVDPRLADCLAFFRRRITPFCCRSVSSKTIVDSSGKQ